MLDAVDGANVGMRQRREDASLAFEAFKQERVGQNSSG